ncbi:MAG: hypothetical protein Q7S07_04965 [Candidatus Omnitrophota bacterium]|nr:hypothetical protein [Candidatus Omnitrophota bacterium]
MMARALFNIIGFVLVTSFAGFNIVAACDKRCVFSKPELAGLSYLFGIGAITIEIFLFSLCGIKFTTFSILLPWMILSIVNIPCFRRRAVIARREAPKQSQKQDCFVGKRADSILLAMTAALLIFVIAYAFLMAMVRPIESYDSVAIWSLKAKILYLAKEAPADFFTTLKTKFDGAHPDYPLLVPLSEVWFYTFINNFNDFLVKVIFPLNFMAFLVLFYAFLKKMLSSRTLALTFTFMLASIRQFSNYATNGYADMQMAIYGSLTFLALYLWIKESKAPYLWTAFFSCVFAIWTKNEGAVTLLGFAAIAALHIFAKIKSRRQPLPSYALPIFMTAILAGLFISWSIFKASAGAGNDVVNAQAFIKYDLSGVFRRLFAILYEYQRQAFGVKYWNLSWIAFISLAALGRKKLFSEENKYLTIPVFFTLLCYTGVYLITPQDIEWHLRRSASRLLIHILPLVIFYIAVRVDRICSK